MAGVHHFLPLRRGLHVVGEARAAQQRRELLEYLLANAMVNGPVEPDVVVRCEGEGGGLGGRRGVRHEGERRLEQRDRDVACVIERRSVIYYILASKMNHARRDKNIRGPIISSTLYTMV